MNVLQFSIPWSDPDMVELTARLVTDEWRGVGCVYLGRATIKERCERLRTFADQYYAGAALRFRENDGIIDCEMSAASSWGHIACRTELRHHNDVNRLEALCRTEPGLVDRFARELNTLISTESGTAELELLVPTESLGI